MKNLPLIQLGLGSMQMQKLQFLLLLKVSLSEVQDVAMLDALIAEWEDADSCLVTDLFIGAINVAVNV